METLNKKGNSNNAKPTIFMLVFIIGMMLLVGCDEQAANISEVKAWGKNFNIIQVINQPEEINELKTIWMKKEKIKVKKRPNFIYKIDIVSEKKSARWLYDPSGYATLLSKGETPIYRIERANRLNRIIISQQADSAKEKNEK